MSRWQDHFHSLTAEWFSTRFGTPTDPQLAAWPHIAAGRNTLVAAPTGSGKTLAAFMVCLDRLIRRSISGNLSTGVEVLYLSPLKALGNDIQRNLQTPLEELSWRFAHSRSGAHRRYACQRTTGDGPSTTAYFGHYARIAVSAAHFRKRARLLAHGENSYCRRNSRPGTR